MVLGSCACCAGVLPFWVICVVYVWRWLCGLVLCIQTTGRLNTKRTRLRTLGRGKCGVKRPTCRTRTGFSFVGALCVARLKRTNEVSSPRERSFSEGSQTAWVLSQLAGSFDAGRGCGLV